ncbi:MAG: hypothetical protein ABSD32_09070 [Mycobacterium sp.]
MRDGLGSHDADVASALPCVRECGFWQVPKTYLDIFRHGSDQVIQWDHVGREKGCAVKHSFYHLHVEAVVANNPGSEMPNGVLDGCKCCSIESWGYGPDVFERLELGKVFG